jgi:predicted alpha/beta-hydrolase family hydrolase
VAGKSRKPSTGGEIRVDGRAASWVRDGALDGRPVVVLAHGAGAPLTHPFMDAVARGLAGRECAVVRFHFPYMERNARESRHGAPDRPPVLLATWKAILDEVGSWPHVAPPKLILAGKSMGGRIASMLLAEETPPGVRGAVYLGYPLSPAGKPQQLRAAHLGSVRVPQLFVSGSRDSLCDLGELRAALAPLGDRARLYVVEGGDHSLAANRKAPLAGSDAWLDVVGSFVMDVTRDG